MHSSRNLMQGFLLKLHTRFLNVLFAFSMQVCRCLKIGLSKYLDKKNKILVMWSPKGWSKNGQDSRSHETEDGEKIAATITNLIVSHIKKQEFGTY